MADELRTSCEAADLPPSTGAVELTSIGTGKASGTQSSGRHQWHPAKQRIEAHRNNTAAGTGDN
jgi:hypothetical protein